MPLASSFSSLAFFMLFFLLSETFFFFVEFLSFCLFLSFSLFLTHCNLYYSILDNEDCVKIPMITRICSKFNFFFVSLSLILNQNFILNLDDFQWRNKDFHLSHEIKFLFFVFFRTFKSKVFLVTFNILFKTRLNFI